MTLLSRIEVTDTWINVYNLHHRISDTRLAIAIARMLERGTSPDDPDERIKYDSLERINEQVSN